MTDVVDAATRSKMMSGIRGKNTKPELLVRRTLHAQGYRYRLHEKSLPGKPDLVLKKFHAAIFIHGCFWHRHECHLFKWPKTRGDFWRTKINGNHERDRRAIERLHEAGWRTCIVWECAVKSPSADIPGIAAEIGQWLEGSQQHMEVAG